jgi:hypothetical protein
VLPVLVVLRLTLVSHFCPLSGKFAMHYVGVSRAQTIEQGNEEPRYNGLTLLGNKLRVEHFVGGHAGTSKHFRELVLIRDEYQRLRQLPVGQIHTDDNTLL